MDLSANTGGSRPRRHAAQEKATEVARPDGLQSGQGQAENGSQDGPEAVSSKDEAGKSTTQDRIQILELHSQNPVISYKHRLYTCHWASTLGTDLFLLRNAKGITSSNDFTSNGLPSPLLALSSIKLVATEAQLLPRKAANLSVPQRPEESAMAVTEASSMSAATPQNAAGDYQPNFTDQTIKIPIAESATKVRKEQATFLERLYAVKQKRGETDPVILNLDQKYYSMPRDTSMLQLRNMEGHREPISEGEGGNANENEDLDAQGDDDEDLFETSQPASTTIAKERGDGEESRGRNQRGTRGRRRGSGRGRGRGRGKGTADNNDEGEGEVAESGRGRSSGRSRGRGRPRGRGRRWRRGMSGVSRAAGGLFRDYRPVEGDQPGAEYRAPEAQLEPTTPQFRLQAGDGHGMGGNSRTPLDAFSSEAQAQGHWSMNAPSNNGWGAGWSDGPILYDHEDAEMVDNQ